MARFYEQTELDIYPDEFIDSCSEKEKRELWEILKDKYDSPKTSINPNDNCLDSMFNEQVFKLIGNRHRLTTVEENLILSIANKL